jgi:hypothetical protein
MLLIYKERYAYVYVCMYVFIYIYMMLTGHCVAVVVDKQDGGRRTEDGTPIRLQVEYIISRKGE